MRINSICMKRGRQLGLTVPTIAPLAASLLQPCLSLCIPGLPPGCPGLRGSGGVTERTLASRSWHLGRIFPRAPQLVI